MAIDVIVEVFDPKKAGVSRGDVIIVPRGVNGSLLVGLVTGVGENDCTYSVPFGCGRVDYEPFDAILIRKEEGQTRMYVGKKLIQLIDKALKIKKEEVQELDPLVEKINEIYGVPTYTTPKQSI